MKLLFCGDYFYDYIEKQDDFEQIKNHFLEYDHVIVNYEGSFPVESPVRKAVNLAMSENSLDLPHNTVLSLANNHVFDYGESGLNVTIKEITKRSFRYFGIESFANANDHITTFTFEDTTICFIGFAWKNEQCRISTKTTPGVVDLNKKGIDRTFRTVDKFDCDFIMVYIHAGYEFEYYPLPLHVGLSRYIIDRGANLVWGSHTHCIQPYEIYKGKYIFYGLGNFYFGSRRAKYPPESDHGVALSLSIDPLTKSIEVETKDIVYCRHLATSKLCYKSVFLDSAYLDIQSMDSYAAGYKKTRTRQANPRPILYYNRHVINSLKYFFWSSIVKITGFLGIRLFLKKLLGWI